MKRICIVTPGNIGSNPRVVKEADSLVEAGYDVRVVAGDMVPWVRARDLTILSRARWRYSLISPTSNFLYTLRRVRRSVANRVVAAGFDPVRVAVAAHGTLTDQLTRAAVSEQADLYIAHYTAAMPAAAEAARRYKTAFSFDAEDYHSGELTADGSARRSIQVIEQTLLPHCACVTAASPRIAEAYAKAYDIVLPTVVLNVFPLAHGPCKPTPAGTVAPGPSLYWFSQTVGPDRGLETAVKALGLTRSRPHLYLRGTKAAGYARRLLDLAQNYGIERRIHILEPAVPADMERLAAAHDVGFVGETGHIVNRRLALTNKLFSYLLAGIPIVASAIPAHRDLSSALGPALSLFDPENSEQLATALDALLLDPNKLSSARAKAWQLGQRSRYNWEYESKNLITAIERALSSNWSGSPYWV